MTSVLSTYDVHLDKHIDKYLPVQRFRTVLMSSRSSRPEVFCKKGTLRNFTKFTGKHLCQRLFSNKVADLRPATLFKKETLAQLFSCEFCKFLQNTSGRLFLYDSLVLRSFRLCFSIGFPDVFLLCSVL